MLIKIAFQCEKIEPDLLLYDINTCARNKRRVQIHHVGIKAVACVSRHLGRSVKLIEISVPAAEIRQVLM